MTRRSSQRGFTMVETLVATLIFSMITVGIVPLIASSLRGTSLSRARTVGENVARQAMERLRGIRWHVSYDAKPNKRVDLLDLYFPQVGGTMLAGQTYAGAASNPPVVGAGGVFTTTCPAPGNPACPTDIPAGHTVTYSASFVKPRATTPTTYDVVTPPAGYAWNVQGQDTPPSSLMDVAVTDSWTQGGVPRSFTLRTIIGDRKFASVVATPPPSGAPAPSAPPALGGLKLRGRATVDYTLQSIIGYSSSTLGTGCSVTPCTSEAIATIGQAESRVETQDVSTADQITRLGDLRVVRTYGSGVTPPAEPPGDLAAVSGAVSVRHAPPASSTGLVDKYAYAVTLAHPDVGADVANLQANYAAYSRVDVANELPIAQGTYDTDVATYAHEGWLHSPQADFAGLRIDSALKLSSFWKGPNSYDDMGDKTYAVTGALGTAGRRVETYANAKLWELRLFRINYSSSYVTSDPVVVVRYFDAAVSCKSTANPTTAAATASWSATLYYLSDTDGNNGKVRVGYTGVNLSGAAGTDPLGTIKGSNPLVYDGNNAASDIYLFGDASLGRRGYLKNWSSNKGLTTSKSADGRATSASINGAIRIDTEPVHASIPESTIQLSLGKLDCEAVDNR